MKYLVEDGQSELVDHHPFDAMERAKVRRLGREDWVAAEFQRKGLSVLIEKNIIVANEGDQVRRAHLFPHAVADEVGDRV